MRCCDDLDDFAEDGTERDVALFRCVLCGEELPFGDTPVVGLDGVARYVCRSCLQDNTRSWPDDE